MLGRSQVSDKFTEVLLGDNKYMVHIRDVILPIDPNSEVQRCLVDGRL